MSESRNIGRQSVRKEDLFSVSEYLAGIRRLARRAGFEEKVFAKISGFELPLFERRVDGKPLLYISSGVHGDEPAGPLGLREVFRENRFSDSFGWMVIPVINPTGLEAGKRETAEGIDLNRDYKILQATESRAHRALLDELAPNLEAALGLHEDWEAKGGYLYEHNPSGKPNPCKDLLSGLRATVGMQPGEEIDGWPTAQEGLIHPPSDPELRDYWPEQIYLLENYTNMSYTVETPSDQPLQRRIDAVVRAVTSFGDPACWV